MSAKDLAAGLDPIARAPVDSGEIIGLSVAVMRGGSSVYTAAHGLADRDAGTSMRTSHPLRLASVSKAMTAALALRLEQDGVVTLDAPLGEWLPEVTGALVAGVTLRSALSHTSGLPDYLEDYFSSDESYYATGAPLAESFVFRYVERTPARFPPGRHWAYSNTGFYLAAVALERAAGRTWAELIRDSLAVPLGLQSVRTCDEYLALGALRGYEGEGESLRESPMYAETGVKGDGGLAMTATDLAVFARGLERGDFLGAEGFARMAAPVRLQDGLAVDYGIGVRLGSLGGHRMWGHTGSLESYVGAVLRFPQEDVTVAVLQNTADAKTGALELAWRSAEVALELPVADLASVNPARVNPARVGLAREDPVSADPSPSGPFDPATYTGDYSSWGESSRPYRTRLSAKDGGLVRDWLQAPDRNAALVPLGDHEFGRRDWPRDRFRFHVSRGRAVAYSTYTGGLFAGFHWRADDRR